MPRIRRWFPVSHDLNGDPEVWELTSKYGDRSLRVWLEILSIADRHKGLLKGTRDHIETALRGRCQVAKRTVSQVLDFALDKAWLVSGSPLRVAKYAEYHRTREPKKNPQRNSIGPPPSLPNLPKHINPPKSPPLSDFLTKLRANPAYKHIDLDRELAKMDAWLDTPTGRERRKTPRFVLNWLNKIEVPLDKVGGLAPAGPDGIWDER